MARNLARTGGFVFLGSIVGAAANFALAAIVGNGLGPAGTGTFFAVVGAFVVASNILELGADTGLIRSLPRHMALGRSREVKPTLFVAIVPVLVLGVLTGTFFWVAADPLASLLGSATDQPERADAFRSLAPFVLMSSMLAVLLGGTRGLGGVAPVVLVQNVGVPLFRLAVVGVLVGVGAEVVPVLQWWAVSLPAAVLIVAFVLRGQWRRAMSEAALAGVPAEPRPAREIGREFWRFSAPRAVAAAIEISLEWVDVLMVALLLSPREAGIYAVVTRIVRVGQLVEHAARVTVSPLVSSMAATSDTTRINVLYEGVTRALVAVALPFYLTVFVFAPSALSIFGPGFDEGATALRIATVGMGLALSAGALQSVILMAGQGSWQLRNKAAALFTTVILLLVLVPAMGIEGAALAWVFGIAVDTAKAAMQARRLGVRLKSPETLRLLVAAVVLIGGSGILVSSLVPGLFGLFVHLALAATTYGAWIWWRRESLRRLNSIHADGR